MPSREKLSGPPDYKVRRTSQDMTDQILMVLSRLPDARYFPSGEKATDQTELLCPRKVVINLHLPTLHSLIVLSALPDAIYFPSGEKATE